MTLRCSCTHFAATPGAINSFLQNGLAEPRRARSALGAAPTSRHGCAMAVQFFARCIAAPQCPCRQCRRQDRGHVACCIEPHCAQAAGECRRRRGPTATTDA